MRKQTRVKQSYILYIYIYIYNKYEQIKNSLLIINSKVLNLTAIQRTVSKYKHCPLKYMVTNWRQEPDKEELPSESCQEDNQSYIITNHRHGRPRIEVNIYWSMSVHHFSVLHTTVCDIQFVRLGTKRKSRMDNPETESILGTKYRTKHKKTIQKTKKTNKN
jgi:hypothetical protein